MRQTKTASTTASRGAGLLRMGLAAAVAVLLSQGWPPAGMAYLATGVAFLFGVFSALGRPEVLLRERLVRVFLDCVLVGVLVAYTGGAESPFFPLYLLAALEVVWVENRQKVAAAMAALVAAYP